MGRWRLVIVPAYVPDSPAPGAPTHPIVLPPESTTPPWSPHPEHPIPPTVWPTPPGGGSPPGFWGGTPPEYIDIGLPGPQPPSGGAPPYPSHPIPPTVWPNPPSGGGGGEPPGFWGGRPPEWVDTTPPQPQPVPPGIWGGQPPNYVDIGLPGPQPPPGTPAHPIYLPPTIWPDPPEGLPSFDPDQIPPHPDLPDLNRGVWYWVDNDGAMERAFIAQVVYPDQGLPGYEPNLPPEDRQPGDWVVALLDAQRPAWAWIPSAAPDSPPETEDDPQVEHHGAKASKA
jgi:hypothetical protein